MINNINKTNNNISRSLQIIEHNKDIDIYIYIYTYDIGNPCPLFDQAHKSGGVKFVEIVHVLDIH